MTTYSNCDRLDVLVSKLPAGGPGGRRENWKTKVDQMKADVRSLQSDFSGFQGISQFIISYPHIQPLYTFIWKAYLKFSPARSWNKEREISDRDQLLSMRFTTNAEAAKGKIAVTGHCI